MNRFLFETLVPLHIGNGETLSPYGDYLFDKNSKTVYLIDQQKLAAAISGRGETIMDEYVQKIAANTRTDHYTLKKFLDDYHIDYHDVAKARIPAKDELKREQIFETVKAVQDHIYRGAVLKGHSAPDCCIPTGKKTVIRLMMPGLMCRGSHPENGSPRPMVKISLGVTAMIFSNICTFRTRSYWKRMKLKLLKLTG